MQAHPVGRHKYGTISVLNFHIWNVNSQSFAQAKSGAKMGAHEGQV